MARVTLPQQAAYYTVEEVSRYLRVAKMTVYRKIAAGQIPAVRLGGRVYRIPAQQFDEWLERGGCEDLPV